MTVARALIVATALLLAGCGGSGDDGPRQSGGKRADESVLGKAETSSEAPIRLCDGSEVEVVEVDGESAVAEWRRRSQASRGSGRWPVIIGGPEEAGGIAESVKFNCEDGHRMQVTLRAARRVNIDRALGRIARNYGVRPAELRGSLPLPDYPYPKDQLSATIDLLTEKPLPKVRIATLPIGESWQAPAALAWGNYNENPGPAVHVAVARDWHRRYGAEIASMTSDTIEMWVQRPPSTPEEALELAREQYRYAPDIVQQGVEDVQTLAAALLDARTWYFWWD